jgi:hypothetical protein
MAIKYFNIFHSKVLPNLPKLIFLFKNKPSGNPVRRRRIIRILFSTFFPKHVWQTKTLFRLCVGKGSEAFFWGSTFYILEGQCGLFACDVMTHLTVRVHWSCEQQISLSVYLSNYLFIYLFIYLCTYVGIYPWIYPGIYLSMYQAIYVSIYLCTYLCIYQCIYLSVYQSVCVSIYLNSYLSKYLSI